MDTADLQDVSGFTKATIFAKIATPETVDP